MTQTYPVRPGRRYPPGASISDKGINFSLYSRHATGATLLLYAPDADAPFQVVALDPVANRSFFSWHVEVVDLPPGTRYTWRLDGPWDPQGHGWLYDPRAELLDPWARALDVSHWDRAKRCGQGPKPGDSIRGVVLADPYDWEGDAPLPMPSQDMVIYELHVGGFTRHPSAGVAHPGSFKGVVEKIDHLQRLGITHVELMPVMAFDPQDVPPATGAAGLTNFWGYSTHGFFAPHPGFCTGEPTEHRREFRDMVKALHRAGIGVLLDVVFNHTAEGGQGGPAIHFKGLGNETFYMLDAADRSRYLDFTGCGNTVNANHPFVARYIIDCLEYWVREMHVDGFRFDLASALARDAHGVPMEHPPVLWGIELSDVLAGTKIIAEAWDAAGLYHVGSFPGYRWMEWNGRYRDNLRAAVRGDPGQVAELATRIAGSSDLYQGNLRHPINSINFVTCHDGFTLADLVSCERKHNEANREGNRDGCDHNLSWNCGAEGDTDDAVILALRRRQARNFLTILMLSQGIPMLTAGDELLRTADGNNNTWCQDNPTGWLDWSLATQNADMVRFTAGLIALRKRHRSLRRRHFLGHDDVRWQALDGGPPGWDDAKCRELAFTLRGRTADEPPLHVLMNFGPRARTCLLPEPPGERQWAIAVDTGAAPPRDLIAPADQRTIGARRWRLGAHSVLVLEGAAAQPADSSRLLTGPGSTRR
ncbi:glycogen debranching protein GlgX [uncultured Thiohalocapsa sp.]|uniref:glycogen debranching protein GlgX n=1 Tax=uncultured Thiohalocapsa sp. TaxID=768990 RepID=UPI0025DE9E06|nr:glycogen debranching protein GlgX [uncultured Thiohalocapsa sp.]